MDSNWVSTLPFFFLKVWYIEWAPYVSLYLYLFLLLWDFLFNKENLKYWFQTLAIIAVSTAVLPFGWFGLCLMAYIASLPAGIILSLMGYGDSNWALILSVVVGAVLTLGTIYKYWER